MPVEKRIERIRTGLKTTSASDMGWDSEDVKVILAAYDEAKFELKRSKEILECFDDLQADNAKLREALTVFADKYEKRFKKQFDLGCKHKDFPNGTDIGIEIDGCICYKMFKIKHFRRAASAVKKGE